MRSSILVASILAFASLALGGCTTEIQENTNESELTKSAAGSSAIAEPKLRDGVMQEPSAVAFENELRNIAEKKESGRFAAKMRDGIQAEGAKLAEPKRDVIIAASAAEKIADERRDVTGNGGFEKGLAEGRVNDVAAPADEDMLEVSLDEAVQVNANR